jgi:hypothetical protein
MPQKICDDQNPIKLESDPIKALKEITGYLRCVSTRGREVNTLEGELEGYWQTPEFLQGCLDIANECERIRNGQTDMIDGVISHALSDIKIPSFEPEGYRGGYLACIEKIKELST